VFAYEVGDDFLRVMRRAGASELGPFILVVEGSMPARG
jgi:hydrogenase small subunit